MVANLGAAELPLCERPLLLRPARRRAFHLLGIGVDRRHVERAAGQSLDRIDCAALHPLLRPQEAGAARQAALLGPDVEVVVAEDAEGRAEENGEEDLLQAGDVALHAPPHTGPPRGWPEGKTLRLAPPFAYAL